MVGEQILISTVFLAGLLSFFSPCILPLLPVYISILSSSENNTGGSGRSIVIGRLKFKPGLVIKTIVFVSGLSTSFIILGFGAGALGIIINTGWFLIICGFIVILLGLHQIGLFQWSFLNRENKIHLKRSDRRDIVGTYLLGFTFSFGWTPCIGPALGAVLGLSASEGQAVYGAFLMFVYALGLLIPFLILSVFSDLLLTRIKKLNRHMRKIQIIGGVVVIIMGILLMTNNFNLFATLITG
ncbi:cytochrome c biogenesis CcdA family protein [Metabacillus fastidiosus]|uniref:cytochrome c biogenesis CcdA family protein n=1 Tax=Metabacillus fastidiosus TaxID=1458 RepID=UPI002E1A5C8D|nr:cytochrome c biogenesis protein CcdA [Metabacillus fastidiosus]MED4533175.1 cytochrome c biogenesis protein CcdA [Metabacillus fastidiosus]